MSEKYAFIASEEGHYPVRSMCIWAGVSRAGYYEWRERDPSATAVWRAELSRAVETVFADSDETYGYRRVHAVLARAGLACDPQTVRSIMAEKGLVAAPPRRKGPRTTIAADATDLPDLLERDFTAEVPATKLVGDITYISTWAGWVYLATVLDCATKKVVGWAMAEHMRTELVTAALDMAITHRQPPAGVIFHSDRGTQYTSSEFAEYCAGHGIRRSLGRTGICYDNAVSESFFATYKKEFIHTRPWPALKELKKMTFDWIEAYYNTQRRHSTLGYLTPREHELGYRHISQIAA